MFENNKTRDIGLEIQSKHLSNDLYFPLLSFFFFFFLTDLRFSLALAEVRKELYSYVRGSKSSNESSKTGVRKTNPVLGASLTNSMLSSNHLNSCSCFLICKIETLKIPVLLCLQARAISYGYTGDDFSHFPLISFIS